MPTTSSSPLHEHKPLMMAWVATVLTIVVFGGILLLMLTSRSSFSAGSATSNAGVPNGLSSTGQGRASDTPDLAEVTLGIEARSASPSAAADEETKKAAAIVEAAVRAGVKTEDVQTVTVSLNPEYDFGEGSAPTVTGYVASNAVRVTVRSVDQVGAIIDGALKAGATNVQGVFYSFSPEKLRKLEDQARQDAMQDALRRATVLSQFSNVRLGKPLSVSESLDAPTEPPLPFDVVALGQGGGPQALQPGSLEVVSHVDVTYEIL
ncbi:MAG: SIMPL domain-containing protein [Candidatus Andersenbacteria bacterium]